MKTVIPRLRLSALVILLATFPCPGNHLGPASLQAQNFTEQHLRGLPPEIARQLLNAPIKDFMAGKIRITSPLPATKKKDPEWVNPLPITLHLRGDSGSPLPTADSLRKKRAAARAGTPSGESIFAPEFQKLISERIPESFKLGPLPECYKDKTTFEDFPDEAGKGVLQDILFISPEDAPTDPDEVFGKKITVVKYDPKKSSSWSTYAKLSGIKCLPSRIRILPRGVSKLEGVAALKNYDSDLYGPGVLHEGIKSRIRRLDVEGGR